MQLMLSFLCNANGQRQLTSQLRTADKCYIISFHTKFIQRLLMFSLCKISKSPAKFNPKIRPPACLTFPLMSRKYKFNDVNKIGI